MKRRRSPAADPWHPGRDRIGADGRLYCRQRRPKVVYATAHEAWLMAFVVFVRHGYILAPYRCTPYVRYGYWRVPGCNRWHLTRTAIALPPARDA